MEVRLDVGSMFCDARLTLAHQNETMRLASLSYLAVYSYVFLKRLEHVFIVGH